MILQLDVPALWLAGSYIYNFLKVCQTLYD